MTKNYLKKFIRYVKKVYGVEDDLKPLTDKRKNSLYTAAVMPIISKEPRLII